MVKVYLDTNILVARMAVSHTHHSEAVEFLQKASLKRWTPVISAHGMAEIYSVLTRAPYQPRISPAEVWQMLEVNILSFFEIESLNRGDYSKVIQDCTAKGLAGGLIYDALHVAAARKAECSRIYTFNAKHFRQIAPDLHDRILVP